ncbi:MAG: type II toxin-antitoxin system YafQ family toxin [Muribaculaceae bacterium]|nr:type II toxin-antitoxin system YafQ family toxin [Muribaculaceae bacterium]
MSYSIDTTRRFDKSLKRCIKRGLDLSKFKECVLILSTEGKLPIQYRPHKLSGQFKGAWECHIEPDWLLVWEQNDTELTLLMIETGTHSDIFG